MRGMSATAWHQWAKWNRNMQQTFIDAQHLACGDVSLGEAQKAATRTGSPGILTVHELTDQQMLGRVWVLTQAELHQHFGAKTPSKKAIEADHDAFVQRLEAGQAVAITAYLMGQPCAVLFAGQPDTKK
jgi:hypothetical protein